jgi:hypothetical protein
MVTLVPSTLEPGHTKAVRDGLFYASAVYRVAAPPQRVLAALQANWDPWWTSGRCDDFRVDERGVTRWKFIPVRATAFMVWFNIEMQPPRVVNNAAGQPEKIVLDLILDGACHGPASYEIFAAPDGSTLLRGSWNGVRPLGWRRFFPGPFGQIHVMVERKAVANIPGLPA